MTSPSALPRVPQTSRWVSGVSLLLLASYLVVVAVLLMKSAAAAGGWPVLINGLVAWLDPLFFQYNLLLMSFAVLVVPLITFCYVTSMGGEKKRRLKSALPDALWQANKAYIKETLARTFRFRNYIGSMSSCTLIVLLGCIILLFLKPLPLVGDHRTGLDYSRGANFLMLGPYMDLYLRGDPTYLSRLITSLTAFQFGFLGAYVYFIGHLVRGYFTLDLTPNTFVVCSVRMATGALLALVLSFGLQELPLVKEKMAVGEQVTSWLPVVSFFIGFFPSRGMLLLEKISLGLLKIKAESYASQPLSTLPGMSFQNEIRLSREGCDNVENLACADPLDLAMRTGFSYRQLARWISRARLMGHLGEDYAAFLSATGLQGEDELKRYLTQVTEDDPCSRLAAVCGGGLAEKVRIVARLVS